MVLQNHLTNQNHYISTTTLPTATKLCKVVAYLEALLLKKLYDSWVKYIFSTTVLMAIKFGRMVSYLEGLPPITSHDCSITWPSRGHLTNYICYISTCAGPMNVKHGKVLTYCKGLLPIKSHNPINMWSHEVTWQIKCVSIFSRSMTIKLGKMVIWHERLQDLKLHDLTLVMWQIDKIISPFSQDLYGR